jgi:hypothetical protein
MSKEDRNFVCHDVRLRGRRGALASDEVFSVLSIHLASRRGGL